MKNPLDIFKLITLLVMVITMFGITSCEKHKSPPTLPPEASFIMDFDNFNTITKSSGNAAVAVGVVLVWNVILTVHMAVPVASFAEAFKHEGAWDKKKEGYVWEYSVPVGLFTYTAQLVGSVEDNTHTKWEMYLSKTGGFQDVLWYEGVVANDGSDATWTLNRDGNNPVSYIQIDYEKVDDENASIKYTLIDGSAGDGSYITFGETSADTLYNRYYDLYGAEDNNLIEIVWHNTLVRGSYTDPNTNSGIEKCWNEFAEDAICP